MRGSEFHIRRALVQALLGWNQSGGEQDVATLLDKDPVLRIASSSPSR